ncbi:MAG: penicillin-binding protein 1A [Peptococcaceae bacterium]|nr:penicillin-binding protein 1A [Peptococcaceae bacterium]
MAAKPRRRRRLRPGRFIVFLVLLFILLAGGSAIGLVAVSIRDMPAWNSNALLSSNSTLIYDKDNKLVAKVGVENRVPISIKEVPKTVQEAFLAAEDHRFKEHHGVDFKGIIRAAVADILGAGKHQGASTITQQLVKLSFLTPEKTFKRKIQEVILAIQVEHYYSKDEILEMYLNKIYFGEGAYGIQSAAQTYFKKDAKDLTLAEAAMLAGIPKAPNYYSPLATKDTPEGQPHQGKLRQKTILQLMVNYGFINQTQADQAYDEQLTITKSTSSYPYPYFVDYVTELLIKKYGENQVYNSGLKVYTTLNTEIQTIAENVMADDKNFPPPKGKEKPQGAVVVMDPANGQVRALVGGREHTNRLGWNRATRKPGRQPGSSIKPIIDYGPAVEFGGLGPASVVDDAPVKYENYEPSNFDKKYRGLITLRTALAKSVNVAAVKLLVYHVTIPKAIEFASRMGIEINSKSVGASLALGTEEVTPLQMAGAYGAFANNGVYNEPVVILRVESPDGTVLEEHKPRPRPVMKPTTAFLLTDMMKSVIQEGTGTNAYFGRPAAGKTGTTTDNKDIWFTGYTRDLVGIVWVGYDNPTPMNDAFGGGYTAKIWNKIMSEAHKGLPVRDFPTPPGIVTATVDSKSGLLPGPNTPPNHLVTDLFAEGTVPNEVDNTHVMVEICATTGQLPNKYCPDRVIMNLISLPYTVPEYVEDFRERVPTEVCTLHGPGGISGPPAQEDSNDLSEKQPPDNDKSAPGKNSRNGKPVRKPGSSSGILPPQL